jgi:hypothetical protein
MGIASLILAIISFVNFVLEGVVAVTTFASFSRSEWDYDYSPFNYLMGWWTVGTALIAVCGIVFGIGGMRQKHRRHSLAIWGLCLNIGIPIVIMFLMLLGVALADQRNRGDFTTASSHAMPDAPWRSPMARVFQGLTIGLMAATAAFYWMRRRMRDQAPLGSAAASVVCLRCKKQMPRTSRFCRRCGNAMSQGV